MEQKNIQVEVQGKNVLPTPIKNLRELTTEVTQAGADATEAKALAEVNTEIVADKDYDTAKFSGMGRVNLRKNIVDGHNYLTQEMISKANTIYKIQYDYEIAPVTTGYIAELNQGTIEVESHTFNYKVIDVNAGDIITKESGMGNTTAILYMTSDNVWHNPHTPVLTVEDGWTIAIADVVGGSTAVNYNVTTKSITIPENCVLEFEGGSISSGTLVGVLKITDCNYKIFNDINFVLEESFLYADYVRPEWFGAKGDYNYNTGIGSDDTIAITKAIEAALILKVYKVKFSSSTYYVNGTIEINSGDIVLEGVYGEYREDFKFTASKKDISANKNSTLISDTDSPIIMTLQGGTHPVVIKHLNFVQVYNNNTLTNNTKGVWLKGWEGPQSPFIFENCHFHRFKYAIYVQSDTVAYNVSKLTVNRCAFAGNYWCLYFGTTTAQSDYRLPTNAAGKLTFTHNACHHNVRGISVALNSADGYVADNVFEGNLESFRDSEIATEPYINYVGLHNASTLVFERNYFEQNTECHLRLNVTSLSFSYMDNAVTIKDNISVPHANTTFVTAKLCEIIQDGGWEHPMDVLKTKLHIIESDYDFKALRGKLGMFFHKELRDVTIAGDVFVNIYTNKIPESFNADLNSSNNRKYFNNEPIGIKGTEVNQVIPTFFNGLLHYSFSTLTGISTAEIDSEENKFAYFCIGARIHNTIRESSMQLDKKAIIQFYDNVAAERYSVYYGEFNYILMIRRVSLNNNISKLYAYREGNVLISHVGIVYVYDKDISINDVDWNFSPINYVSAKNIENITNPKRGDKVIHTQGDVELIYRNRKWVDNDGAKAGVQRAGLITKRPALADINAGFMYLVTQPWEDATLGTDGPAGPYYFDGSNSWILADGTTKQDGQMPTRS